MLVAAAIGGLSKFRASISGPRSVVRASWARLRRWRRLGSVPPLGGSNARVENAAEIALEHHLGMTCDPAGSVVQVPCIERNGMRAIKAVSAASLTLHGDGVHFMPPDNCIETMRQTDIDMNVKYKETATGGLESICQSAEALQRETGGAVTAEWRCTNNQRK